MTYLCQLINLTLICNDFNSHNSGQKCKTFKKRKTSELKQKKNIA